MWTNVSDSLASGIGVYIEPHGIVFLSSCRYVFVAEQLGEMYLSAGDGCEDWRSVPYGIEVVSSRHSILLFEPGDGFWECWDAEGLGASGVVAGFKVWVGANRGCLF